MSEPDDEQEYERPEREHEDCDWCGRGSCGRYSKCGGPDDE